MMREKERCRFKVDMHELSEFVYELQSVAVSGNRVLVVDVTPFVYEPREGIARLDGRKALVVQVYPTSHPLWFQWFVDRWLE